MKYNNETLLEMVELYAFEMGLVSSEGDLSDQFDEEVLPAILEAYGEKGVEFTDTCMICEAFSNWSDSLCKEGEIHPEQYNSYCYIGEYS